MTEHDYTHRAIAAYYRAGGTCQPSAASGIDTVNGLRYVHLFSAAGTLAVYRIQPAGRLKRLKRWPQELEAELCHDPVFNLAKRAADNLARSHAINGPKTAA